MGAKYSVVDRYFLHIHPTEKFWLNSKFQNFTEYHQRTYKKCSIASLETGVNFFTIFLFLEKTNILWESAMFQINRIQINFSFNTDAFLYNNISILRTQFLTRKLLLFALQFFSFHAFEWNNYKFIRTYS